MVLYETACGAPCIPSSRASQFPHEGPGVLEWRLQLLSTVNSLAMLRRGASKLLHPQLRRGLHGASAAAGEKRQTRGSPNLVWRTNETGAAGPPPSEKARCSDPRSKHPNRFLGTSCLELPLDHPWSPDGSASSSSSASREKGQGPPGTVPAHFPLSRATRRYMGSSGRQMANEIPAQDQPVPAPASSASESESESESESPSAPEGLAPATASAQGTLLSHRPPRRKTSEAKQAGRPPPLDAQTGTTGDASALVEPSASLGARVGGETGGKWEGGEEKGEAESEEAERVLAAAQERVESAILGQVNVGERQAVEAEEEGLAATDEALQSLSPALEAVAAGPWLPTEEDRERIQTQLLQVLEGDGWRVTNPVLRIWQGERDGLALTKGLDVGSAQAVLLVLFRAKAFEKEHGPPPPWTPVK